MKKFSICIPNYNYAQYIGETIESVLSQTYQDFEICIADNASTDNSWEVIQGYCNMDSRIKAICNKHNLGFAGNLDNVSSIASGEWIIMLSSDDMMLPEALAEYARIIEDNKNDKQLLINSSVIQFDNEYPSNTKYIGTRRGVWQNYFVRETNDIVVESTNTLLKKGIQLFNSPYNFVSLCYSREAYLKAGGYESSRLQNPDKWFHWKVSLHATRCIFINKPLFKYRWHNANQLSIQNKTKVLRYWIDEYRNCFEIDSKILSFTGLTQQDVIHAFLKKCINNYAITRLRQFSVLEGFRIWSYGVFTYPKYFIYYVSFWVYLLLLITPLLLLMLI